MGWDLFAVLAALAWLTRSLRLFDLVTAKGQDMLTLAGQASLITVPLGRETIYICLGVGIARALSVMQNSRELHTIHISGRISALWGAVALYIAVGTLAVVLLTNWLDPLSRRQMIDWSANIAADLVGRSLQPGQFTPVAEGVTLSIGGRQADGTVERFLRRRQFRPVQPADLLCQNRRNPVRRERLCSHSQRWHGPARCRRTGSFRASPFPSTR